jgi:hypothetical protein
MKRASMSREAAVAELQRCGRIQGLTLYLGSGVSKESGVPDWKELVAAMYFAAARQASEPVDRHPYPNYLYAIAEWYVGRNLEPLEVTARKVRARYRSEAAFMRALRRTLYGRFLRRYRRDGAVASAEVRRDNHTLDAVVRLCTHQARRRRRVRAVVTLNFDNLLELLLPEGWAQPVWSEPHGATLERLLVYHVHGYVPLEGDGSSLEDLVFAEDRYHSQTHNAYAWTNLVQMHALSSTTALMIGLSLTDRNLRRLLDATIRLPNRRTHFAILKEPDWPDPTPAELDQMHDRAVRQRHRFERPGAGRLADPRRELQAIIAQVEAVDRTQAENVLLEFGVQPVWIRHFDEIPALIDQIL